MMKAENEQSATIRERIGFIGAGLMAEALIGGLINSGMITANLITASDISDRRLQEISSRYGVHVTTDNMDVVKGAPIVVLAIKPQHADDVLAQLRATMTSNHLVISMMAGVSTEKIRAAFDTDVRVIRVMPNIATLVQEAASAIALGASATRENAQIAELMFSTVGLVATVEEELMDAVTGLSGSGPAYIFTVIESLADGGVAEGLPRDIALKLAAQTVLGAAKLVLSSGEHPAILRDRVTSPAGTTAEGLLVLEECAVRGAFASAVRASAARSGQLGSEEEA